MLSVYELKEKQRYRTELSSECIMQGCDRESIFDECDYNTIQFMWYFKEYIDFESLEEKEITKKLLEKMVDKVNEKHGPFSENQIYEIRRGFQHKKCIDIKCYFNNQYKYSQMEQIRWGIEDNLEYEYYAKEDYTSFQMNEIRLGLMDGLDVSQYCDPNLTEYEMYKKRTDLLNKKQLKKGLA